MINLLKAKQEIDNEYFKSAIAILEKESKSLERDYLLALAHSNINNDQHLKLAYDILIDIFFNSNDIFRLNTSFRVEVIELLEMVSKKVDKETFNALTTKDREELLKSKDILRAIYFGKAKYGLTMAEKVAEKGLQISDKLTPGTTIYANEYFIQFYKNYSSYTPLLKSSKEISVGGGYFINLDKYGLVVDPGHNFLDNFYSAGRSFEDINGILVTHFHDDHYADLPSLLALIFQSQKNKYLKNKKYDLFLDTETYQKFEDFFKEPKNYNKKVRLLQNMQPIKIKDNIFIETLRTNHSTIIKNSGVGTVININNLSTQLFITGDTGWSEEINDCYKGKIKYKKRVLVAHISSLFNEEAISYINKNPIFYEKHLCIHGLIKCIECLDPGIVILSEIGEELAPIINDLTELIRNKYNIPCFVGMNGYIQNLRFT